MKTNKDATVQKDLQGIFVRENVSVLWFPTVQTTLHKFDHLYLYEQTTNFQTFLVTLSLFTTSGLNCGCPIIYTDINSPWSLLCGS